MSYRFFNPAPVLHDLLGIEPCAGGSLAFFDRGTTTPRLTWADAEQAVPNPNPVPLDSSGRVNNNVWLDGAYTVVLKDAAGQTVWTRDVDSGSGAGQAIPTLITGQFLTNDGSNLAWAPIAELPDPTGAEGYQLEVVSGIPAWAPKPPPFVPPEPDWDVGAKTLVLGGFAIQTGNATIPASSNYISSVGITFPTPFTELFYVGPAAGIVSVGSFGAGVTLSVTGYTPGMAASGCTINANCTDDGGDGRAIASPVPVAWVAIGKVAA